MAETSPLTGVVLVDCARANADSGVAIAAQRCGYGDDVASFQAALKVACAEMDIEIEGLTDLITPPSSQQPRGIEVAPDTSSEL